MPSCMHAANTGASDGRRDYPATCTQVRTLQSQLLITSLSIRSPCWALHSLPHGILFPVQKSEAGVHWFTRDFTAAHTPSYKGHQWPRLSARDRTDSSPSSQSGGCSADFFTCVDPAHADQAEGTPTHLPTPNPVLAVHAHILKS